MNEAANTSGKTLRYWPLWELVIARLREFIREPEAVFWVYGFPILMTTTLGIAFRGQPAEQFRIDVVDGPRAAAVKEALTGFSATKTAFRGETVEQERYKVSVQGEDVARQRLRTGRTELVVIPDSAAPPGYEFVFVPSRSESRLARDEVDGVLQRAAGRRDVARAKDEELDEPGGRYVDFLVPGLLGMGIMGGGLWGVGFVTVDMRIRKLLKRFLATPMRKVDFLASLMVSRLAFMVPEVLTLLVFARLAFGVKIEGSLLAVVLLILLGSFTFAGLGLLVASRAKTMEAVSGLMNLVMLPMWILSGIFFSPDRFPDAAQPFIQVLPLTPLIKALRAVMLEGAGLWSQGPELAILAAWGAVTFVLALRWFRWN
jgi:ABC-type multidrug transport system permease subunit